MGCLGFKLSEQTQWNSQVRLDYFTHSIQLVKLHTKLIRIKTN